MGEEMEANTCYLGIELNDSYAMVSYMQPNMEEPETVSTIAGSENYRIPTLLALRNCHFRNRHCIIKQQIRLRR